MANVAFTFCYAERHYDEYRYDECRGAKYFIAHKNYTRLKKCSRNKHSSLLDRESITNKNNP